MSKSNWNYDLAFSDLSEKVAQIAVHDDYDRVERKYYDNDPDAQLKGIDLKATLDDETVNIDAKAIAGSIPTFSFELYAFGLKEKKLGWFNIQRTDIETDKLLLEYIIPEGDTGSYYKNKELVNENNIKNIELLCVDKNRLHDALNKKYENQKYNFDKSVDVVVERIKEMGCPEETLIFGTAGDNIKIYGPEDKKKAGFYFVYSGKIAEKPLNVIVKKSWMQEQGVVDFTKTINKEEWDKMLSDVILIGSGLITEKDMQIVTQYLYEQETDIERDFNAHMNDLYNQYNDNYINSGVYFRWEYDRDHPDENPYNWTFEKFEVYREEFFNKRGYSITYKEENENDYVRLIDTVSEVDISIDKDSIKRHKGHEYSGTGTIYLNEVDDINIENSSFTWTYNKNDESAEILEIENSNLKSFEDKIKEAVEDEFLENINLLKEIKSIDD